MDIETVLKECNNFFYRTKEVDRFTIADGNIEVIGTYLVGQYIRISNSMANDGIYKIESIVDSKIFITGLIDETFEGTIYGLAIPKSFINLVTDIETYDSGKTKSNTTSESFNNYSVSYAKDKNGSPLQWQGIFKSELDTFRQMYDGERWAKLI